MDTRVPPDDGGFPSPSRPVADPLEQRLAAVERRLAALEGSIREAVAQEVQGAGDDLRRAVSDLGRLLLRDLDRLTKVLAEHRDAIVERLSAVSGVSAVSAGAPGHGSSPGPEVDGGSLDETEAASPPMSPMSGEEGRWRLPGRRRGRRSPENRPGGDTSGG